MAGTSLQSGLQHRAMDLRVCRLPFPPIYAYLTQHTQTFRIQALICKYTRSYLDDRSFIEIHTKLQPATTTRERIGRVQSGLYPASGGTLRN